MNDLKTNFNIENYDGGCLAPKKDLRDYRINTHIAFASELPDKFEVKHSEIKNQGGVCSCVAHSVCEVLEAINDNKEKYSTNWIYGYRPFGYYVGKGMYTRQACKTASDVGYVLYDDFKGNDEMNAVKETVDKNITFLKDKAKDRKTFAYASLKNREEIKKAIFMTRHPVVVCVHCCSPFIVDDNNELVYSDKFGGYHAMVCYGWNERGLLLQNSWGENFGDHGTCILPDNYPFSEAWLIANTQDEYLVLRPKGFWLRQLLQAILNFIIRMFNNK